MKQLFAILLFSFVSLLSTAQINPLFIEQTAKQADSLKMLARQTTNDTVNNAFYAVNEKLKPGIEQFKPVVSVKTENQNDGIKITVKDNGNGIPERLLDKIFQPFFTTKPTRQGTGLGLSLAYDIVKSHGGEIKVESKEGKGTDFIIQLPITPISHKQ